MAKSKGQLGSFTHIIADIEVLVVRKRVKNINLRVRRDGTVVVSAAPHIPIKTIEAFVASRRSWIESAQQRVARVHETQMARCVDGGSVLVWGLPLTCSIAEVTPVGTRPICRFSPAEGMLFVEASGPYAQGDGAFEMRDQALERWLRSQVIEQAQQALPHCEQVVGTKASRLRFRRMSSRWGSCNVQTAAITLNTELIHYPKECLSYVLTHELCHLHEPSHNARFHALMDQFCPDWRRIRLILNAKGA